MIIIDNKKFYTIEEAAKILDLAISSLRRKLANFPDAVIKIGGVQYIPAEKIEVFTKRRKAQKK